MKTLFTEDERRTLRETSAPSPGEVAKRFERWKADVSKRGRIPAVALAYLPHEPEEKARLEKIVGAKVIAAGSERLVFDRGRAVLKVASGGSESVKANRREHELWEKSKDIPALRAILVPVVSVAPDGRWLVMEKARPTSSAGEVPSSLPVKLYDVKPGNWGRHGGALKMLDYSLWS